MSQALRPAVRYVSLCEDCDYWGTPYVEVENALKQSVAHNKKSGHVLTVTRIDNKGRRL